ncbi:YdgA family protein [Testudinibacter sp. P27/CKL/0425]
MKKSVLAVSIIGALAVAWGAGTWYTGKQFEAKYAAQIEMLNKEIALYLPPTGEVTLKVENVSYQRNFFSAEIQDKVVLRNKDSEYEVRFDSHIQHGPLPLSNLAKLNLKPVLVAGQTQLAKNELVEKWFAVSKGQNPFVSDFSVSYSDNVVAKTRIAATEYSEDNVEFRSSEVVIDSDTNLRGIGDLTLKLDQILFHEKADGENVLNTAKIQFDDIAMNSSQQTSQWQDLSTGTQAWTVKNISFDLQPSEASADKPLKLNLNEIEVASDAKQNGGFFDLLSKVQWQALRVGESDFGKFQFNLNVNKLDGESLNKLITLFRAMPADGEFTPEQEEQAMEAALTLLKKQPEVQFLPLALTNSGGTSQLNLDLGLAYPESENSENPVDYLSKLEFSSEINKKMLQQLIDQINTVVDEPKDPQEVYQQMVEQVMLSGSFIETPEAFTAKLILENGQFKHNGEVVPQEKVEEFLFSMIMAGVVFQMNNDHDADYRDDFSYDETDGEAAEFDDEEEGLFSPDESFDLSIPDLSPSDLQGLPSPQAPQQ